jgi:hypothetical protein
VCPSPKRSFQPLLIHPFPLVLPSTCSQVSSQFSFNENCLGQHLSKAGFQVLEETQNDFDDPALDLPSMMRRYHVENSSSMREFN